MLFSVSGCRQEHHQANEHEVVFKLSDSVDARFLVRFDERTFTLQNGLEPISMPTAGDGVYRVPVFGGGWYLDKAAGANPTSGFWVDSLRPPKDGRGYRVDFTLEPPALYRPSDLIDSSTWDVWFDTPFVPQSSPSAAQLDLWPTPGGVGGTMRTPTGDYRFLSGTFRNDSLVIQTFDGAHLYRFDATKQDDQWVGGRFFSGNHYQTRWAGSPSVKWPDAGESVTTKQVDVDSLFVRILDRDGQSSEISLRPEPGNVFVLDILGTWCPNCMDEIRLLHSIQNDQVQLVSIAFERDTVAASAYRRIDRYAAEMDATWPFYLGGRANKQVAADAFPFLDRVISFPTTLFIQHDGAVHVHSGFNGPATGDSFEAEKGRFQRLSRVITSLENRSPH